MDPAARLVAEECSECHGCDLNRVDFTSGGNDAAGDLGGTGCWEADCDEVIPCALQLAGIRDAMAPNALLTALYRALRDAAAGELIRRIQESGGRVEFNRDRAAIQVQGCSGEIVAHLPLDEPTVAALEEVF